MFGGNIDELDLICMSEILNKTKEIHLNGNGLFSKEEVIVSIKKAKKGSGITFILNSEKIPALVQNVSNATRNTVLSKNNESICLIEHFLSTCSILNIDDIEVYTNKNELIIGDGSAIHWEKAFKEAGYVEDTPLTRVELKKPVFIKKGNKEIVAIPHDCFQASYYMDFPHPALGKLFASYKYTEDPKKILQARTFASKQENDYFGVSDLLLTLDENKFNKPLHEPLEPVHHKILDIIGDLRLCGLNPLSLNMHIIGFKSGHEMNVEMAKELNQLLN